MVLGSEEDSMGPGLLGFFFFLNFLSEAVRNVLLPVLCAGCVQEM